MAGCCVPDCNEPATHRFPKDKNIRKLWLKAVRLEKLIPNESTRLCRNHFTDDDYIRKGTNSQHNYLHKLAVPSIFPWTMPKTVQGQPVTQSNPSTRSKVTSIFKKNQRTPRTKIMCSVPKCNSRSTSKNITFHSFPKNISLKKKWQQILNISKDVTKEMKVCSLHFDQSAFVLEGGSTENILLKRNAIPSQKVLKLISAPEIKKEDFKKSETMCDTAATSADVAAEHSQECRACLKKSVTVNSMCNMFQPWSPGWIGMELTIAEDLAKIANIEISLSDLLPTSICDECYQSLLNAAKFATNVRRCDGILRERCLIDYHKWPRPIQVDKNINNMIYENSMVVDIKQEVLSEEEYNNESSAYMELDFANLDIKVEPEEILGPPPMQITINGTMSLDPIKTDDPIFNGNEDNGNEDNGNEDNGNEDNGNEDGDQDSEISVKQEPVSDDEDSENIPDLSLECLLCTKMLNSVSGLKAHVISQHSYKSVKRKNSSRSPSPVKNNFQHICEICKRSFTTSTDLMVHETCHNMHSCYGCKAKFDTFELLSKHRRRCKASTGVNVQKLKTLDDVIRQQFINGNERHPCTEDTKIVFPNNKMDTPDSNITEDESNSNDTSISNMCDGYEDMNRDTSDRVNAVSDRNMKLRLEIHSATDEETMGLGNMDLKVEPLCNDDEFACD